jgi:hypothetical protein
MLVARLRLNGFDMKTAISQNDSVFSPVKAILPISSLCAVLLAALLMGCAGNRHDRSMGEYIDDKATVERVADSLKADTIFKLDSVDVRADRGTIQLSGFVQTSEQKDRAQKIAEDTPGVEDVINNITVRDERPDARR